MPAAADIMIRRCTVQVVRHGGWSWGPQPQRLIDQVLAALPGLIAERLADLAPDGASEDVEITEPVRIAVSLPLADLLSGRFAGLRQVAMTTEPLPEPSPAPGTTLQQAPARPHQALSAISTPPLANSTPPRDARTQPMTLAQFLGRLYELGKLAQFLALLPVGTLEAWYQSLAVSLAQVPGTRPEAGALPAWPGDRPPGSTGYPAAQVPDPLPGVAATLETARSRQLRDAISAIAVRVSQGSTSGPHATGDSAPAFHDRPALAAASSAGPQPPGAAAAALSGPQLLALAAASSAGPQPPGAAAAALAGRQPPGAAVTAGGAQPPGAAVTALAGRQPPGAAVTAGGVPPPGAAATARGAPQPPGAAAASSAGPQPLPGSAAMTPALAAAGTPSAGGATSTGRVATTSGVVGPAYVAPAPVATAVADVGCALPFLLLGPLAQAGYLSALEPALQPVGLQAETAAFAAALAYTVLGSLERGWRRQPEDLAGAAAFAGLASPVPGQTLTDFARIAGPALPALDAVITQVLAEGHTAGEPLVLAAVGESADGGLVLFDREGLFPVAWADAISGLVPAWRMFGSPPVLVAPTAVGALRGLADAGVSFVVAAPPARAERWRRLPPYRLWTNSDDPALAQHASGYQQAVDLAAQLTHALADERAAIPLAATPALGRSLLLAAGLGLGTLAWTLWREREPPDPLLALERFADLSARVSFEPDRVLVRLPLGPRHSDLSVHGLLADVHGVPWFGDRVVQFSGG